MIRNPVAANLLMLFFLLGGAASLTRIKQEVFPDVAEDTVTISVPYPGASPEEVEKGIILSTEEAIRGIEGVKELQSTASEGSGRVVAELYQNTDYMKTYQDIKSEIDRITTYPEEAEEPVVTLDTRKREVLSVAIHGDCDEKSLREIAERARDYLLEDEQITQIDLSGIRDLEISIEVPVEMLRRHALSLSDIKTAVQNSSLEIPGGAVKTEGGEILIRVKERKDYGTEFRRIPVINKKDGTSVLLGEIATVKDGFEESDRYATYDGKPAVMLDIYRVGDQTPISVSDAVMRRIEILKGEMPPGIDISVLRDMADIYRQRLDLMIRNGTMGAILVFFLLALFLELRLAFWVMLGVPVSFLGAFIFMPSFGLSLNMITMFALIMALGIVVDDAIVVGENIYSLHEDGMPLMDAAIKGTREIISPVSFSITTNIAGLVPLGLLPGMMGKILWMLPAVVCLTFLVSWAESVFILPCHVAHQSQKPKKGINLFMHDIQQNFSRFFIRMVKTYYRPFLEFAVRRRYAVLLVSLAILSVAVAYVYSGRMGFEVFPKIESDYAYAYAKLPYGSHISKAESVERILRASAAKVVDDSGHPELSKGIFSDIGKDGAHTVEVRVFLADSKIRSKILGNKESTQEFVERWRKRTGEIAGLESITFQSDRGGPGGGAALTIELRHRSMETLRRAGEDLAAELNRFPIVKDVDDGFQPGKRQFDFKTTAEGESLGMTPGLLSRILRDCYEGAEAVRQQRGRNEIKIKIRLPAEERISEHDLDNLIVRTPSGAEAPLMELAHVARGRAYTQIARRNGKRAIQVTADVTPRYKAVDIINVLDKEIMPALSGRHPGLEYSYEGRQADSRDSFMKLNTLVPIVLLVIYIMLAVPFKSYLQPTIIMVSIPMGFVGAVAGHLLMGYNLSMMSLIGILALSGVVVNDAIVLLDFANRKRDEGATVHDAIVAGGVQRFRPIMLTTLTTFGGLAPMIFESSRQARFLIPMAISLGYGLLFATLITLLLVPSLYLIVEDARIILSGEGKKQ